jgi:hypothetical protein
MIGVDGPYPWKWLSSHFAQYVTSPTGRARLNEMCSLARTGVLIHPVSKLPSERV